MRIKVLHVSTWSESLGDIPVLLILELSSLSPDLKYWLLTVFFPWCFSFRSSLFSFAVGFIYCVVIRVASPFRFFCCMMFVFSSAVDFNVLLRCCRENFSVCHSIEDDSKTPFFLFVVQILSLCLLLLSPPRLVSQMERGRRLSTFLGYESLWSIISKNWCS